MNEFIRVSQEASEAIARIRAPAGPDVGAETPGEIALSILAEILGKRRRASGRPLVEVRADVPRRDRVPGPTRQQKSRTTETT